MTRVLYIEDEPNNRMLVRRLFMMMASDLTYCEADNARTGIEMAQQEPPDLILMDISMPDMDGLTATAKIRTMEDIRSVPIIALTANAMEGDKERFIAAGCDGYISKPIDIDTFIDTVRGLLPQPQAIPAETPPAQGGD
jgi:two-component system cell cycle response regulator DivK